MKLSGIIAFWNEQFLLNMNIYIYILFTTLLLCVFDTYLETGWNGSCVRIICVIAL